MVRDIENRSPNTDNSCVLNLPNGERLELFSKSGVDRLLELTGELFLSIFFLPSVITPYERLVYIDSHYSTDLIHERNQAAAELKREYIVLHLVAGTASPRQFQQCFPREDLRTLVRHFVQVMGHAMSSQKAWHRHGKMDDAYAHLIYSLTSLTHHKAFVDLFCSEGGPAALALLYSKANTIGSDGTKTMDADPAASFIGICLNIAISKAVHHGKSRYESLRELSKSGLLRQALSVILYLSEDGSESESGDTAPYETLLDALIACPELLASPSFQEGGPMLEKLEALAAKVDSFPPSVADRVKSLMMICSTTKSPCGFFCRTCGIRESDLEDGKRLLLCSRCHSARYCSKYCQKQDWAFHKQVCRAAANGSKNPYSMAVKDTNIKLTGMFVQKNYVSICVELNRLLGQHEGAKLSDAVLVLDFYQNGPAFHDEFKVGLVKNIFEGSRPHEPDWFFKESETYQENLNGWLMAFKDQQSRMTPNHLMITCRSPGGSCGVHRVQGRNPTTGEQMWSDDAVRAVDTTYWSMMDVFERASTVTKNR